MLTLHGLFACELVCYLTVTLLLVRLFFDHLHRRTQETSFNGPPSPSWLFGVSKLLAQSSDSASLYERWSEKYGLVYTISATLGKSCLVLCDPKAVQHFYSGDTYGYVQTSATRALVKSMFGHCVLWAEGATHKRHRKALVPAFSPAAIKAMLPIFYDSAHKVKFAWDSILAAEAPDSNSTIIDVQEW
ncbi:hypothetical protein EVJ58_g744 [Rhodofomes roseus]|uniref:Cytochrome P450 n=1 Tax=Rhodofomes roseus TaxID=34475 RepID=A0A4Y9Z4A6_9APHY|nr:hypothetical protein EVJ58_g744 [Rhodofomes roseus]